MQLTEPIQGPEDLARGPEDLARGPEDLTRGPEDLGTRIAGYYPFPPTTYPLAVGMFGDASPDSSLIDSEEFPVVDRGELPPTRVVTAMDGRTISLHSLVLSDFITEGLSAAPEATPAAPEEQEWQTPRRAQRARPAPPADDDAGLQEFYNHFRFHGWMTAEDFAERRSNDSRRQSLFDENSDPNTPPLLADSDTDSSND